MKEVKLDSVEVSVYEIVKVYQRRKPLTITISEYPELEGLDEEKIQNYILENGYDMKPINSDVYESLLDELKDQDIEWDDSDNVDFNLIVE
jgi:hypothetical protein